MWGIANTCWFLANSTLGFTTAFPIITSGPGIVSSIWGVVLFREIKGVKNVLLLFFGLLLIVLSSVCTIYARKPDAGE